jgi:hypothetical protein
VSGTAPGGLDGGLDLVGLTAGPAQTWGAVRLVPLLRAEPITDLRLHARLYGRDELSVVEVAPRTAYVAFVPHAFVASWTSDGTPVAAHGTQLLDPAKAVPPEGITLRYRRRMARRTDKQRLRFMPLHLALEGYLALQFAGPSIAWEEWTREAVNYGLSPRVEAAYTGGRIPGLDEALRVFEVHPGQCGMALYLADALATVFVVPHPDDYRALHPTLLQDMYGELLYQYVHMYPSVPDFHIRLDGSRVASVADLRVELARAGRAWSAFHDTTMIAGLLGDGSAVPRNYTVSRVYTMGRFHLARFLPRFDPDTENHLGDLIRDESGRIAYLKTFRLSAAQVRRGHLLSRLAAHGWDLDATAADLGTDRTGVVQRLDRAGFGHLLRPDIIDAVRNQTRRRR